VAVNNIVVGSVDYNGYADISSIAGLAGNAAGRGALAWASTGMCTPAHTNCTASGYVVDTNAYVSGYTCGPWWTPWKNTLGYTHSSATAFGTGSFSMYTGCSSTGGGRNLNIVQGQLTLLYYYSSNYMMTLAGPNVKWPPTRAVSSPPLRTAAAAYGAPRYSRT
jgi:hypothetical protein